MGERAARPKRLYSERMRNPKLASLFAFAAFGAAPGVGVDPVQYARFPYARFYEREDQLRIVTYNIKTALTVHGDRSESLLQALCRQLDADILGLQEILSSEDDGPDQVRKVAEVTDMTPIFARTTRANGIEADFGHALLVRGEVLYHRVLDLPVPPPLEPRSAILARVRLKSGLVISVAEMHLTQSDRDNPRWRIAQAQLRLAAEALMSMPGPHVLIGDMNMTPGYAEGALNGTGLKGVPTGDTFFFRKLDVIYFDSGINLSAAEAADHPRFSDHAAVVAGFSHPKVVIAPSNYDRPRPNDIRLPASTEGGLGF